MAYCGEGVDLAAEPERKYSFQTADSAVGVTLSEYVNVIRGELIFSKLQWDTLVRAAMTSQTQNVSCICCLPKAGKSQCAAHLRRPPGFSNDPSEIQSAARGVDRKIARSSSSWRKVDMIYREASRTARLLLAASLRVLDGQVPSFVSNRSSG